MVKKSDLISTEEILNIARSTSSSSVRKNGRSNHAQDNLNSEVLFKMAKWGKETDSLNPWQRKFIFNMGIQFKRNYKLSEKQENALKLIIDLAYSKGFVAWYF